MNPAVTLAFAVVRRLAWIKVPAYWIAQLLGAFIASAVVYGIYHGKTALPMSYVRHYVLEKSSRNSSPLDTCRHSNIYIKEGD